MAISGNHPQPDYNPHMDAKAHEGTYQGFMHFAAVGTVAVLCIVVALAIGGVKHAWATTLIGLALTTLASVVGIVSSSISWKAPTLVLVLLLILLAV
jgi:hypothetical protein